MELIQPTAPKKPHVHSIHGHDRIDDYFWLNNREDAEVIKYLNEENDYTNKRLGHLDNFRESLFREMKGRIKEQDESVPYTFNGYEYYLKYVEGGEYPVYCRKYKQNPVEEVMVDCNHEAEGTSYFHCPGVDVSPDNKTGMYAIDVVGRRIYSLMFKDLSTGKVLNDVIAGTTGNSVWANDNRTVFYSVQDETTLRSYRIYKHVLGTPVADDVLIYEEQDETFTCYVSKTKSEKYILITISSTTTTETRYLDASEPGMDFIIFSARKRDHEYSVDHLGDKFYIVTNKTSKNFSLMETSESQTGSDKWNEVIKGRKDVLLEGIDLFDNYMVLSERKNGLPVLRVLGKNGDDYYIDFGEAAYNVFTSANPEHDTTFLRYVFNSMVTPNSTFEFDMNTRNSRLLKQQEVVGGYEQSLYRSERLMVPVTDGTHVPVSLVYRKDKFKKDGSSPLLQYGYGSYGYSIDATFSTTRLSLLDRGFAFAICHIRGGEEMGRDWYDNGKLINKKNTFTDFIDCSKYLIAQKYCSNDNLFAMGGSAGGLLMGVIINERPDLYKGVVAAVPFVDVVTTMLDASIPLTTGEYDEWGNPNEKTFYEYILSYSPYDNVKRQNYPNLLVTTGLHDSQVQYWEPAKWVAKLRECNTGTNMILLHTNMDAGHGGASGRFNSLKELALEYAFIIDLAGKVS